MREVAAGYTIVGNTYEYNVKNQLTSRYNLVRDELHKCEYDARGPAAPPSTPRTDWLGVKKWKS